MRVINLTAEPNPRGRRIDLAWTNPEFSGTCSIVILRREGVYPIPADIGTDRDLTNGQPLPAKSGARLGFSDDGLNPETVYYYAVIACDSTLTPGEPVFVSSMATAAYHSGEQLYRRLPAVYQRHDTMFPPDAPTLDPGERDNGQLRRLMALFGLPLDLLRSYAAGMRNFSDVNRIDGALLPLLAESIGWQNDYSLPLDKQRNEIKYGPHYYRTNGIAANVRATINRLTTWDVQIREFFHSVARSNDPEQLTLWERQWRSAAWQPPTTVTLDVAYEGKPALVPTGDGRQMLLYHARQRVPSSRPGGMSGDQWHLWYKILDEGRWTPSRRLSSDGAINKHPAAVLTPAGTIWVFWSAWEEVSGQRIPRLKLSAMAAGRAAEPACIKGTVQGPFTLSDGDNVLITIQVSTSSSMQRRVVFHPEDFADIAHATTDEIAAVLNRELPGVDVSVSEGKLVLTSSEQGKDVLLTIAATTGAAALGLEGTASGRAAQNAVLAGSVAGSAALAGRTVVFRVDDGPDQSVVFTTEKTAEAVAATINAATRTKIAEGNNATGAIAITSPSAGGRSCLAIDVDRSTAAADLGFGAPVPAATTPAADSEPVAIADAGNNIWLFWCSRRSGGTWKIWYNRFDGALRTWGAARRLTAGDASDRQPAAVFDPAGGGTLRVFWSRKKSNGLWNIFYRSTAQLDFNSHPGAVDEASDAVWADVTEMTPVPAGYDRKDPCVVLRNGQAELFYCTNQTAGWKICTTTIAPAPSGVEQQITAGHFTHRAPAVFEGADGSTRLLFRSNETQMYTSRLYPTSITRDARYAGTTTVDTRNAARIRLQNKIEDILHYTYDTGSDDEDWYTRDKIGIYLTPSTDDEKLIIRKQRQIQNVLRRFLPIQVRAVFIVQRGHDEFVYTYDKPDAEHQVKIGEQMIDTILGEVYPGVVDSARTIADFRWLRTWSYELTNPGTLPDLTTSPPDLSARLPVKGVEEGE